jgi:peroxygenase
MPPSTDLALSQRTAGQRTAGQRTAGQRTAGQPTAGQPTALQRHVAYFDPGRTGRVRFTATVRGIRALGPGWVLSVLLAVLIHTFLGPITNRAPRLSIDVSRIALGVHGGDSGIFDAEGNFAAAVFESLWEETLGDEGRSRVAAITREDFLRFMHAHGEKSTVGGWFSNAEATLLFCVAADAYKDVGGKLMPALTRPRLRAFYAGTLLPAVARLRRLPSRRAREEGSSQRIRGR